jgi:NifB/MoaA-like Fe-S oxidoreductase
LAGRDLGDVVFLPRVMFDATGRVTLDDLTLGEIESRVGVPVSRVGFMGQMLGRLRTRH